MIDNEAGPVYPARVLLSGARAGGNNVFSRGGPLSLCLLEKGREVANLVDFSLMEKRIDCPLQSRPISDRASETVSVLYRCYIADLPHLKPTASSWFEICTAILTKHWTEPRKRFRCYIGVTLLTSHTSNRPPPHGLKYVFKARPYPPTNGPPPQDKGEGGMNTLT